MSEKVSRVDLAEGYILHTRPYRETSLLVKAFTRTHGLVDFVARGARQTSLKKSNHLQLFTAYHFSWTGRTALYTLTQAEQQGAVQLFSPMQLCCGLYINELMLRVLAHEDANTHLYLTYQQLLQDLIAAPQLQIPLRIFEKNLLETLGYGFSLDNIIPNHYYIFKIAIGFVQAAEKTPNSFSGESLIALFNHALEEKHLAEIKRLMRLALSPLVGDKPLRSRELFVFNERLYPSTTALDV